MKNILAENMLRFGVKNLSEKSKKKLAEESKLDEQGQATAVQPSSTTTATKPSIINIAACTTLKTAAAEATTTVKDGSNIAIAFNKFKGAPQAGDAAIAKDEGVIRSLGGNSYLVIGNVDTLIKNPAGGAPLLSNKPTQLIQLYTISDDATNFGGPNILKKQWSSKAPLIMVLGNLVKILTNGNQGSYDATIKSLTPILIDMWKKAATFGVIQPTLPKTMIDIQNPPAEWITQVSPYIK
jgi:hypothetical protein